MYVLALICGLGAVAGTGFVCGLVIGDDRPGKAAMAKRLLDMTNRCDNLIEKYEAVDKIARSHDVNITPAVGKAVFVPVFGCKDVNMEGSIFDNVARLCRMLPTNGTMRVDLRVVAAGQLARLLLGHRGSPWERMIIERVSDVVVPLPSTYTGSRAAVLREIRKNLDDPIWGLCNHRHHLPCRFEVSVFEQVITKAPEIKFVEVQILVDSKSDQAIAHEAAKIAARLEVDEELRSRVLALRSRGQLTLEDLL